MSVLGFNIIPITLIGEMFSSGARNTGTTITMTAGWVVGFAISTVFGTIVSSMGAHFAFWMFAAFCVFTFLFSAVFVIETKGKEFSEIQEILSR